MAKPKALIKQLNSARGVWVHGGCLHGQLPAPGCVLFGKQGAAWVVGDPWLTLDC